MTKLINDGRAVTQVVNDMLSQERRWAPKFHGEVQYFRAYMFGHYDSRGGGFLLKGAKTSVEALALYNLTQGWDLYDEAAMEDFQNSEGKVELVVCDRPLPDDGDILDGYQYGGHSDERGYLCARLERRYVGDSRHQYNWEPTGTVVLWVATLREEYNPNDADVVNGFVDAHNYGCPARIPGEGWDEKAYEYRLNYFNPGEDACGLYLMRVDPKVLPQQDETKSEG